MDGIDDDEKYPAVASAKSTSRNARKEQQFHDDSTGIIKYDQTPLRYHLDTLSPPEEEIQMEPSDIESGDLIENHCEL